MGYWGWKPYVPVAKRREQAARAIQKAKKAGQDFAPITLPSRTIASTFWGKAWCDNLKAYSDFANRLPRGGSYVRNGAVIDLKIEHGKVIAQVLGSSLYRIEIGITPLPATRWKKLVGDCAGSIDTLMELLQGKFSNAVMARICEPRTGLFPSIQEIQMACSCPDWAMMCKHVAAALYGVGARLDEKPELLFVLRQVDPNDLLSAQAAALSAKAGKPAQAKVLDGEALADVFGIEMATVNDTTTRTSLKQTGAKSGSKTRAAQEKSSAGKATPKAAPRKKRVLKKISASTSTARSVGAGGPVAKKSVAKKSLQKNRKKTDNTP